MLAFSAMVLADVIAVWQGLGMSEGGAIIGFGTAGVLLLGMAIATGMWGCPH